MITMVTACFRVTAPGSRLCLTKENLAWGQLGEWRGQASGAKLGLRGRDLQAPSAL